MSQRAALQFLPSKYNQQHSYIFVQTALVCASNRCSIYCYTSLVCFSCSCCYAVVIVAAAIVDVTLVNIGDWKTRSHIRVTACSKYLPVHAGASHTHLTNRLVLPTRIRSYTRSDAPIRLHSQTHFHIYIYIHMFKKTWIWRVARSLNALCTAHTPLSLQPFDRLACRPMASQPRQARKISNLLRLPQSRLKASYSECPNCKQASFN